MANLHGFRFLPRMVYMKKFNITKQKTDWLQRLYAIQQHYAIVGQMAEKEIGQYIISDVLPDFGLEADDFKYCSLDIVNGILSFDDEKKKEDKGKKKNA